MMTRLLTVIVGMAAVAACGEGFGPQQGDLWLTVETSQPIVSAGEPATFTLTLHNLGSEPVILNFASTCQILPYIIALDSHEIIYPRGGGWGCLAMPTVLQLEAGPTTHRDLVVERADESATRSAGIPLPEGPYIGYAELRSGEHRLRSEAATIIVR